MSSVSIRSSAMNYLSIREHSKHELKNKLLKKYSHEVEQEIDQTMTSLISDNLQSDERFSEAYVRMRKNKGFGPIKITYELYTKGVSNELIQSSIYHSENDWLQAIEQVWIKKFSKDIKSDQQKQSRFLYQRGFSHEAINQLLRRLL